MTRPLLVSVAFSLSFLVSITYQVDVTIHSGIPFGFLLDFTCSNLLPGECCAQQRIAHPYISVVFRNLQVGDIAAVWQRERRAPGSQALIGDCSGTTMETAMTPGYWSYQWAYSADSPYGPSGASYIRLPPRLPPDQTEVDWLNVEGMKALAWGGGKWLAGTPSGLNLRKRAAKTQWPGPQISKNRGFYRGGKLYATSPPRMRSPDLITVNGTKFRAEGTDGSVYKDAADNMLDLEALGG
ncbi:MAG: hypothetical protein Q9201_007285 [Fulgogasparrea decipioides]